MTKRRYTDSDLLGLIATCIETSVMLLERASVCAGAVNGEPDDEKAMPDVQGMSRYFEAGIGVMFACHRAIKTRRPPELDETTQGVLVEVMREASQSKH